MDYKETLNLPQTDFPMRGNLPKREPEMVQRWKEMALDSLVDERAKGKAPFILHDGPPYANGHIHIGHALNKVLKDIILKSKRMKGHFVPYVPGWDCHGLPIELMVDKKLGKKKRDLSKAEFRQLCREYATEWVNTQRDEFIRLGILGRWDTPYLTMTDDYEAATARELAKLADKGALFKGRKPVHWCPSCVTALAEAEVEYDDHSSPSIYVKFAFTDELPTEHADLQGKKVSFVIWTTTPWTIPANLGIALNPELDYAAVDVNGEVLVVAEGLVESVMKAIDVTEYKVLKTFGAAPFEKKVCQHPFYDRTSMIILGDHVTLEAGTGCVHTAPGHGQDDYVVGLQYGLDVYNPVNNYGKYVEDVEFFAGLKVQQANPQVIEKLTEVGALLNASEISHSYPHCWRCKKPIIFRATEQWFVSMEANDLRTKSLAEIDKVNWIPAWGRDRIYNMVENRPDWCISRQRTWGVPITVVYCEKCDEAIADGKTMHHIADQFEDGGSDKWYTEALKDLLPEGTKCPKCDSTEFRKEMDILDVWFDSGVSHAAVAEPNPDLGSPVDLYLEGSDQHRGWFHSSLLESVGTRDRAPYKSVLTHGFVLDAKGRPMSKSLGNVIKPEEVIKKYGAEILRLWVAAQDYRDDTRIGEETLQRLSDAYRRIRNTARYFLGMIHDFDPATDCVADDELLELDRWALSQLEKLVARVEKAYDDYEFHVIYHTVHNFCAVEMSSFYMDVLKDRTYISAPKSVARRSAQTAMYKILDALTRMIAPVLSFTADEIWQYLPGEREESAQLAKFPRFEGVLIDAGLDARYEKILAVREQVQKSLEEARTAKQIGNSLEAKVKLTASGDTLALLQQYADEWPTLLIVSQTEVVEGSGELAVEVLAAEGEKCPRCWNYATTIGDDSTHPEICHRCVAALKEAGC